MMSAPLIESCGCLQVPEHTERIDVQALDLMPRDRCH